jgi:hypothetical protein
MFMPYPYFGNGLHGFHEYYHSLLVTYYANE